VTNPDEEAEGTGGPATWLVDGFNLLHTVILGGRERAKWWQPESRQAVLARVAGFDGGADAVWVVFDGPQPTRSSDDPGAANGPRVVFAASADDWILKEVRRAEQPNLLAVVTADRKLADRCRHAGAVTLHPRDFAARCQDPQNS
jgi:hypothetical protein